MRYVKLCKNKVVLHVYGYSFRGKLGNVCAYYLDSLGYFSAKVSEYDLEMPQSKTHYLTAVQPRACADQENSQRGPTSV